MDNNQEESRERYANTIKLDMKEYTQEEILKNISIFQKREDELIVQRKELNKELNRVRKQKENWEGLDLSQLKLL